MQESMQKKLNNKKIPLIVVLGPTASGKTNAAVTIAKHYNGEIISADSMQLYKGMSIGTAKPTLLEMDGIPHHLIDILELSEPFSVADYAVVAHQTIAEVHGRGKLPILVGGTGLYINAVVSDMQFSEKERTNEAVRSELAELLNSDGKEALFSELLRLDPEEAQLIDKNNPARLIRALEICITTNGTMTEYKKRNLSVESRYSTLKIGLSFQNREQLYERINLRVDKMLVDGLLDEARTVLRNGGKTAMQAIGYKELANYINGTGALDEAVERIKQESRRYAKRQLTWFRRDPSICWVLKAVDTIAENDIVEKKICSLIDNFIKICYT